MFHIVGVNIKIFDTLPNGKKTRTIHGVGTILDLLKVKKQYHSRLAPRYICTSTKKL